MNLKNWDAPVETTEHLFNKCIKISKAPIPGNSIFMFEYNSLNFLYLYIDFVIILCQHFNPFCFFSSIYVVVTSYEQPNWWLNVPNETSFLRRCDSVLDRKPFEVSSIEFVTVLIFRVL